MFNSEKDISGISFLVTQVDDPTRKVIPGIPLRNRYPRDNFHFPCLMTRKVTKGHT